MKHVYIVQCGVDVVFCSSSILCAYEYLFSRLTVAQQARIVSYMSVTRHFKLHDSFMVLSPDALTWYIKQLIVQKKSALDHKS